MADHGAGFVPPLPPIPVATDYSYNWVNINHGEAFVPGAPVLVGGPDAWYFDFGQPTEPEPPTSTIKVWTGTAWEPGPLKIWDGTAWADAKIWDGDSWSA